MNSWITVRVGLAAALLAVSLSAFATDPMSRRKGEPATFVGSSFGQLVTVTGDDDTLTATFDNGGKLSVKGNPDNPSYVGFWTADTAPTGCDSQKDGTAYWGKIKFEMSDAGRTYTGAWGYCDAEPTHQFQAKWDGN
jgi:hypothetical protein